MELQEKDGIINAEYEEQSPLKDGVITKEEEVKRQNDLRNGVPPITTFSRPTARPTYVHTRRGSDDRCCCLWCWFCTDTQTHSTVHQHHNYNNYSNNKKKDCCDGWCDCNDCCECWAGDCDCGDCDCNCGDCGGCDCGGCDCGGC